MISPAIDFKAIAPTLTKASIDTLRPHFAALNDDLLTRLEGHAASVPLSPARAHLFASLAVSYRKAGDGAKATKLINRALNSSERLEDTASRIESLCAVASVLHDGDLRDGARESLGRAQALAGNLAGDDRGNAGLRIAATYDRLGDARIGLQVLRDVAPAPPAPPVAAVAPAATTAQPATALAEPESAEELAELDPLDELEAFAEPVPAPVAGTPASGSGNGSGVYKAPSKSDIDEGDFRDPVAGVKFPSHRGRKR